MDEDALKKAVVSLVGTADRFCGEDTPDLEELGAWGERLPDLTYALVHVTRALRDRVLELGNRFVLVDDRGRDPEEALIETADALRALSTLLERAHPAASEFQAAIGHLGVDRALEPGEAPSVEVKASTAAAMARSEESTTHVDQQPASLMNDTVQVTRTRP